MKLMGDDTIEVGNKSDVWKTQIKKLSDIVECFSRIGVYDYNADLYFNHDWYPVVVKPHFFPARRHYDAYVAVNVFICFGKEYLSVGFIVYDENLSNEFGKIRKVSLEELFREFGFRPLECCIDAHNKKLERAQMLGKTSTLMTAHGYALQLVNAHYHSNRIQSIKLGNNTLGEKVILEAELDYEEKRENNLAAKKDEFKLLPFVG